MRSCFLLSASTRNILSFYQIVIALDISSVQKAKELASAFAKVKDLLEVDLTPRRLQVERHSRASGDKMKTVKLHDLCQRTKTQKNKQNNCCF